jgi:hypothetical protein
MIHLRAMNDEAIDEIVREYDTGSINYEGILNMMVPY